MKVRLPDGTRRRGEASVLIAAAVWSMAACDESDTGAQRTTTPAPDPLVAELCPGACAAAQTCYDLLDVAECETQCELELGGTGYLCPEIARKYFRILKEGGEDTGCYLTKMMMWEYDPSLAGGYAPPVDDLAVFAECIDRVTTCVGYYPGITEQACFMTFYRFNDPTRALVRECFSAPCVDYGDCVCGAQPSVGQPWVAVPAPPPDPEDPRCPPEG